MPSEDRFQLNRVLEVLGPSVTRVIGPTDRFVSHPAAIHEALDSLAVTFCSRERADAIDLIRATKAGVVLCGDDLALGDLTGDDKTLVVVKNPRLSFLRLVQALFSDPAPQAGIHSTAIVHPDAVIDASAYIGPFCYLGECAIGPRTVIHGHVHVYSKTRIGADVIIHAGTVIGLDGFGFERNEDGELEKFPHVGGVVIEDNVEIASNTTVQRGTMGDTVIRHGAKIDSHVHVGHNMVVGRHAVVTAHTMIAGSVKMGDYAWIAPGAMLMNRISIGNGARVGLGAVVVKDVPDGETVMGVPARPAEEYKQSLRALRRITLDQQAAPDLAKPS